MIQDFQLIITNDHDEAIQMTDQMPCFLTEYTGLDSPGTDILSVSRYNSPGAVLNGAHVNVRNVVLNVYIFRDVPRIRQMLYRFFKIGKQVNLHYEKEVADFGPVIREIDAVVESVHFSVFGAPDRARQMIQISLICTQPYLRGAKMVTKTGQITYNGDADVGFRIGVPYEVEGDVFPHEVITDSLSLELTHGGVTEVLTLKADSYLSVVVDTEERKIWKATSNVYVNAIDLWTHGSVWPKLKPGVNNIVAKLGDDAVDVAVTYTPLYQGV